MSGGAKIRAWRWVPPLPSSLRTMMAMFMDENIDCNVEICYCYVGISRTPAIHSYYQGDLQMRDAVVVTATFYNEGPDLDVRLPLAIATIRAAAVLRLPIIVVDGSPDPEVRRTLEDAGAEVIAQKEPGFGPAVRQ